MLPEDVKVTRQTQDARFNQDGTSTAFIRVEFTVGKHGPFIEKFDKDTYSRDARDAKLTTFANEVR